jgi:phage shock protein PspC (stress-responsive transcriptional regulator)
MIAGVCGGLADYLNVDPTVIRLVFLLLLFAGGGGLFIYLILWVIMPLEPISGSGIIEVAEKPENEAPVQVQEPKSTRARKTSPPKKSEES